MARSLYVLLAAAALAAFMAACAAKAPVVTPGAARFPDYPFPVVPAGLQAGPSTVRTTSWRGRCSSRVTPSARGSGSRRSSSGSRASFRPAPGQATRTWRAATSARPGAFEATLQAAPGYGPRSWVEAMRCSDWGGRPKARVARGGGRGRPWPDRCPPARRGPAVPRGAGGDRRGPGGRRGRPVGRGPRRYLDAVAASPDSAFLYRELASVERRAGRPADALAHARDAVARDPADASAQVLLGRCSRSSPSGTKRRGPTRRPTASSRRRRRPSAWRA